jgi:predicted PurR-regulated permease PerM
MQDARRPGVGRLGRAAWHLVGVGTVVVAAVWLLGRLWVLVVAFTVAVLSARGLAWPTRRLRRLGLPHGVAALTAMAGLTASVAGLLALVVPELSAEIGGTDGAVERALDDLEDRLVEGAPFGLDRDDVERIREGAADAVGAWLDDGDRFARGALIAAEVVTALALGAVGCFVALTRGGRLRDRLVGALRPERRALAVRLTDRAWHALGGYLLGAVILGTFEAVVLGAAVWASGGDLVLPVAVLTFLCGFVPFAGAVVAGVVAVLVTLASAGAGPAMAVAVVAVGVQQFDDELLAPIVYARALAMHPLLVLTGLVAGTALFGAIGGLLSVPVLAVAWNVADEYRDGAPHGSGT